MSRLTSFGLLLGLFVPLGCVNPHRAAPPPGSGTAGGANSTVLEDGSSSRDVPYSFRNVEILGGGFVTGIIFSKTERGLVYARTDIGGAYRMEPGTDRWIPINDMFGRDDENFKGVESLALDPNDANKVYMAVGTYTKDWAGPGAMLRSVDRGKSWDVVRMPIKMGGNEYGRSAGERLAVDPNQPDVLLFGSRNNGLYASKDGSRTWKQVEFPTKGDHEIGILNLTFDAKSGRPGDPTPRIYAGVGTTKGPSLFVTEDAGKTWAPIEGQPKGFMAAHVEIDSEGTLFIAYRNQPGPNDVTSGAIYRYQPKTGEFVDISPITPGEGDTFGYGGVSLDPQHPGTLIASTLDRWTHKDEIFYSKDTGNSWIKVGSPGTWDTSGAQYLYWGREELGVPHWIGDIDIDPFDSGRALFVTGAGVWASTDLADTVTQAGKAAGAKVSWHFENRGLEETAVLVLASPPQGPPLISGMGDICGFRHDDLDKAPPGGFFMDPQCNSTTGLDFAARDPNLVVRVGRVWNDEPHGAFSKDGGKTWTAFTSEPPDGKRGGMIAITADGKSLLWTTKSGTPVHSSDMGKSWQEVTGVREAADFADWADFDLQPAADRENPKIVYLYDAHEGHFYVSRDAGASFQRTKTGLPELPEYALLAADIEAVPGKEGHLWLSTSAEVFRSTDAGATFQSLDNVEKSYAIGVGKPARENEYPTIYLSGQVGGTSGLFRSTNEGKSWQKISDADHQFGGVNVIEGDPRIFGRVYLGTHGRGIIVGEPSK